MAWQGWDVGNLDIGKLRDDTGDDYHRFVQNMRYHFEADLDQN